MSSRLSSPQYGEIFFGNQRYHAFAGTIRLASTRAGDLAQKKEGRRDAALLTSRSKLEAESRL
jgi:hypothetical protein